MTGRMDPDLSQLDELDFARQLLAAAEQDAPPPEASARAFQKLAGDARALAALTALAPLTPPLPPPPVPVRWWQAQRAALGWVLLGAVVGGGAVALWLAPAALSSPVPPPLPRAAGLQLAAPSLDLPLVAELVPAPVPLPERASGARAQRKVSTRDTPRATERASRLAREVAALDAARAALAVGAGASVLRQIERYHREFPAGELTADAEAVAIEALAMERDHAALAAAAQRFLQRHPHDPHADRVRELAFLKPPLPGP